MLSIIVAIGNSNVIGKDNKLIWHLPNDLKRFKELTTGKTIIMGRKTFESLGRVLPKRKHIVLCRSGKLNIDDERVEIVKDVADLENYINDSEEHFVIGGASIYKLLLDKTNKMYITKINEDFDGDTFFPQFDEKEWKIVEREKGIKDEQNPYDYEFITYVRK